MSGAMNLVGGAWEAGKADRPAYTRASPFDAARADFEVPHASLDQITRAVSGAAQAQREWSKLSVVERGDRLLAAAELLRTQVSELAEVLVDEVGKTVAEAQGEILNAARLFEFHAGSTLREKGTVLASGRPRTTVSVEWEPVGVVAAVTPWNFPVNISAVKLGPALAAGNGIVLKPALESAYTATAFVRLISGCFPDGLIGLVQGDGVVGEHLTGATGVDSVSFTGSTAVGRLVSAAAAARGIPSQCEMGGRNTIVVMLSADLDTAVPAIAASAFRMGGQKCTAAASVVVHTSIHNEVVRRLVHELDSGVFALGDPRQASTVVGPLISRHAVDQVSAAVADATDKGATLSWPTAGSLTDTGIDGAFVRPALLTEVTPAMEVFDSEVFGPVLIVIPVESVSGAVESANVGGYGLVSAIFTTDLGEAMHFSSRVAAGTVLVNQPTTGLDFHAPFGGWGLSGQGPTEQSDQALRAFMRPKTRYLSWSEE